MPYLAIMMWVKLRISNRSVLYVSIISKGCYTAILLFLGGYYLVDWTIGLTYF